jgi:hypothetical protein
MLALAMGCGGSVDDGERGAAEGVDAEPTETCERSAYELERTRYRCTSDGELQTLDCGEWLTLEVCAEPEACSPGPEPGCN